MTLLAAVKFTELLEVAWVSLAAGVSVTAAFSFVVYASGRSAEARRQGRLGAASAYGGVTAIAGAAFVAVVAYGVHIILSKS